VVCGRTFLNAQTAVRAGLQGTASYLTSKPVTADEVDRLAAAGRPAMAA